MENSIEGRVHLVEQRFRRLLFVQVALVLLGAVALVFLGYSISAKATEYRQLKVTATTAERDLAGIKEQTAEGRAALAKIEAEYATLKANTEKLYAVNVMPSNQVYAVKASAKATGRKTARGKPLYDFSAYIDAPTEVLDEIANVTYTFKDATFAQPNQTRTNAEDFFRVSYNGWGCLPSVGVAVLLKNGTKHSFNFDMCRSIGW